MDAHAKFFSPASTLALVLSLSLSRFMNGSGLLLYYVNNWRCGGFGMSEGWRGEQTSPAAESMTGVAMGERKRVDIDPDPFLIVKFVLVRSSGLQIGPESSSVLRLSLDER